MVVEKRTADTIPADNWKEFLFYGMRCGKMPCAKSRHGTNGLADE
jgi:sulfite exporter TauE/SafE